MLNTKMWGVVFQITVSPVIFGRGWQAMDKMLCSTWTKNREIWALFEGGYFIAARRWADKTCRQLTTLSAQRRGPAHV